MRAGGCASAWRGRLRGPCRALAPSRRLRAMDLTSVLAEAAVQRTPNLWGALGCALTYAAALFATVDA